MVNKDDTQQQSKEVDSGGVASEQAEVASTKTPEPEKQADQSGATTPGAAAGEPSAKATKKKPSAKKEPSANKEPLASRKPSASKKNNKSVAGFFYLLLVLLLLAGLAASGYWFYGQRGQTAQLQQLIDRQQQSIETLDKNFRAEQMARQRQVAAMEQISTELQRRVNSQSQRLRELSSTTRSDWLLAEAEYLMRLASQRLVTERNAKNPLALLETADQILKGLDEVDLYPVRQLLAHSITRLRMAGVVDREGLFLQLESLTEQVVKLPLLQRNLVDGEEPPVAVEPVESQSWQARLVSRLQSVLDRLADQIRVSRRDNPVEPLLSQDEELFIRHNLRILLEQAQLSLLREEPSIYKASLNKARRWLGQYFELNGNAAVLADQLERLAEQQVVQELPDISDSLEALRVYIDSWHKRQNVEPPSQEVSQTEVEQ